MKICILRAGALGCSIGAALAEASSEVWLINRSSAHVEAINGEGLRVGDECTSPTDAVTRERILAYAELTGDRTPLHVDEEDAKRSHFGALVAHGLFGLAIADGLKTQSQYCFPPGMSLGWTWDFALPIKAGGVLHVKLRVGSMRESRSKPDWGIVVLPSELINQRGEVVQKGEHRLMVPRRPESAAVRGATR